MKKTFQIKANTEGYLFRKMYLRKNLKREYTNFGTGKTR